MESNQSINLTLHVWRQDGPEDEGRFETYEAKGVSPDWSFLEMLDQVNNDLIEGGKPPIAFDSDCREGICGTCGCMVNGQAHGGQRGTTLCQLHMRHFTDGAELTLEPWRSKAFPVIRDLVVDRGAFDKIIQAHGYISVRTGGTPDANALPIAQVRAELAMDA
ncbi:MAG: succinate dehydrogenase/fumarate reductase iron-sulfur subunit, partial [Deltaproteobacteria bacterium]|nr:succinate dehydrogenase/fumarate reductase iron-sulfur subunit [Deltaproteobacteria bacterium]